MPQDRYDNLHFFIDESGSFDSRRDLMLVGGVLLFGSYDRQVEDELRSVIADALSEVGGDYPESLHFADYHQKDPETNRRFVASLKRGLDQWRKDTGRSAYAVLIRYRHDVYEESPGLLAERELDNRYISMLWSLIEHFVFVNEKVSRRLTDDAAIHLHVSHRRFPFKKDEESRRLAEALRWHVTEHRKDRSKYIITTVLNEAEIRGMFRISLRDRWSNSQRHLASVEVSWLNYNAETPQDESTPALYMADLLLGVERLRVFRRKGMQSLLPMLDPLQYDRNLETLSRCKAGLQSGGIESLLTVLENSPVSEELSKEILPVLAGHFQKTREPFYRLFETAMRKVDHPRDRAEGLALAHLLESVYRKSGVDDLRSELYTIMIPFSAANHSGDTDGANEFWDRYLEWENRLPLLGVEAGMEFGMEFRCRRAVSLMDQFRFAEAEAVLVEIGAREEDFRERMSDFFGADIGGVNLYRLGICYSTLAQSCAFQSFEPEKRTLAEELFRNALNCFDHPADRERIWVYLGHLACDSPGADSALWEEAAKQLRQLCGPEIDCVEKPFVLAVSLKGALVFGNHDDMKCLFDATEAALEDFSEDLLNLHPYGLVQQMLGLLAGKIAIASRDRANREKAFRYLRHAEQSFRTGAGILHLLADAAAVRRSLLLEQFGDADEAAKKEFAGNVRILERRLRRLVPSLDASPDLSASPDAQRLLSYFRFNYW